MAKQDEMNALTKWMYNNPEAFNMGLGLLGGIQEDRRNRALSGAEIAKTQYGYLTGAGTGDISRLNPNNIPNRVLQGAMTGLTQRRDSDFQNKLLQALQAKKGTTPARRPASIKLEDELDNKNEYNPIAISPQSAGDPNGQLDKALKTIGVKRSDDVLFKAPDEIEGDTFTNLFEGKPKYDTFPEAARDTLENRRLRQHELDVKRKRAAQEYTNQMRMTPFGKL